MDYYLEFTPYYNLESSFFYKLWMDKVEPWINFNEFNGRGLA